MDVATAKAEKDSEGLKKAEIEAVRARQWSDRISRFRKGMGV